MVESGVIRFVGSKSEALSRHPNPEREGFVVHDLRGATVLPGFHDVHVHALDAGSKVGLLLLLLLLLLRHIPNT